MKKLLVLLFVITFVGIGGWLFLKREQINKTSDWKWKEYPQNFVGVDCNTVPESLTARPGSDVAAPLRNICWEDRAWYENNWEICNNLDSYSANHCLEWMAIKLKDTNICRSEKVKDIKNCGKLVTETSDENTWHYRDYINKGLNPI